ncbi:uncharacterized protein LOC122561841 [Chiloscyllium plagiosum]|uniref:uncharacterized protein LOC122561841 n=1 Tax=Chiloscyllium plagiosum TaxID=36176 RepID=UPI001CB7E718|nr:uncharacterized protein LOC122561841 [Chiloscyllium plagiosum]
MWLELGGGKTVGTPGCQPTGSLCPVQMLPPVFEKQTFRRLNCWFSTFIWHRKWLLIKLAKLQLPHRLGEVDLTDNKTINSARFYLACDRACGDPLSIWLDIETSQVRCPLTCLMFLVKIRTIREYCHNPMVINTAKAWRVIRQREGNIGKTPFLTPIVDMSGFQPGMMDSGFKHWAARVVSCMGDLFEGDMMLSFDLLVWKHKLSNRDLLHFFQVRDFIQKKTTLLTDTYKSDIEERVLSAKSTLSVSTLYQQLGGGSLR